MKNIVLFLLITALPSLSQTKEASTPDGETFILHTDGTWSKKQANKKHYKFENANAPYYLRDSLINFEVVKAKFEAKVKGLGYGGVVTQLIAFKGKSNVRFNNQSVPRILFKHEGMLKPQNLFTITKAKEKRKKRQFLQNSVALGGNVRDTSENEILFKLKKIENNIYEIILEEKLEKGEYGIIPALNNGQVAMTYNYTFKIYCFGVD